LNAVRLLILSLSGRLGGAERVLLDIVAETRARRPGWPVAVVSVEDGPLRQAVEAMGATYDVVGLPHRFASTGEYGRHPVVTAGKLIASLPGLIRYSRRLRRHLQRWQPDLVHANGLKGHILSAWVVSGRMRLLWHVHDYVSPRAITAALFRRFSRRADRIVANSKSVATDVEGVLGGDRGVDVLHNGIDCTRFSPEGPSIDLDAATGQAAAPSGTVRIGLVATYARWKGHETFLEAVSRLPPGLPVRAYVIGGPAYQVSASQWTRAELIQRASNLGLDGRVGFLDFQVDTSPVYRALDVVVHASTAPEPFGLVIAEAMSCGRSVVISEAGGAREIGDPELTCVAHPPGDVQALARQMERLVNDAALRARLGAAAAVAVRRRFSRQQMGDALHAIYQGMSDGRAG